MILHLVEEILTGFRQRFPLGEMPKPFFVGVNVFVYGYAIVMIAGSSLARPFAIPMAWGFAVAMLLNGTAHLAIMLLRRGYFPGGVTAWILVATSLLVLGRLAGL